MPRPGVLGRLWWGGILLLGLLVRFPLWLVSLRTPLDGDVAIIGLMARHVGIDPTFWGQPYGSPVESWIVAPFVALLGPTVLALRLPYLVMSLALIPLAHGIAHRIDPRAAKPAALLLASPPAYLALLAALPPPLYPTTLVLTGLLLLGSLVGARALTDGGRPYVTLTLWGAGAGLAAWTHLVSLAIVLPAGVLLFLSSKGRAKGLIFLPIAAGLMASSPLLLHLGLDAGDVASVSNGEGGPFAHALALLPRMQVPVSALFGMTVPPAADTGEGWVHLGWWAVILGTALALGLAGALARAIGEPGVRLMIAAVSLVVVLFPLPMRSGPEAVRFLSPAFLPLGVLVACGAVWLLGPRRAWAGIALIAALQLVVTWKLAAAWRQPDVEFTLDCTRARDLLVQRGETRVWAGYNQSYCMTYMSGERVIASQPWNERFPGYPLPLYRGVRAASPAVWLLSPRDDYDLPTPERFEATLKEHGGDARRTDVGDAVVYDDFVRPFSASVTSPSGGGSATDGDPRTRSVEPPQGSLTLRVDPPRRVGGVTLVGTWAAPGLPEGLIVESSSDGVRYERVGRLKPGHRITWTPAGPAPRTDLPWLGLSLDERVVSFLRLTPAPAGGAWAVAEILLHAPRDQDEQAAGEPALWESCWRHIMETAP